MVDSATDLKQLKDAIVDPPKLPRGPSRAEIIAEGKKAARALGPQPAEGATAAERPRGPTQLLDFLTDDEEDVSARYVPYVRINGYPFKIRNAAELNLREGRDLAKALKGWDAVINQVQGKDTDQMTDEQCDLLQERLEAWCVKMLEPYDEETAAALRDDEETLDGLWLRLEDRKRNAILSAFFQTQRSGQFSPSS